MEHADRLGCDPGQVSVMGESAGGNLAALVALAARDAHREDPAWPALVHQLLLYPITDLTLASPSIDELPDAPMLQRRSLDWFGARYVPQGRPDSLDPADPWVSPLHAPDKSDLPPTLLVAAGQDPLRDDALALRRRPRGRRASPSAGCSTPTRSTASPRSRSSSPPPGPRSARSSTPWRADRAAPARPRGRLSEPPATVSRAAPRTRSSRP